MPQKTQRVNTFNYNVSILKKNKGNYLYIYNTNYCCMLKVSVKITLIGLVASFEQKKIVKIKNTSNFLRQFFFCIFTKIKFMGKGYKIKKNNNNNLMLLFNRAHITNIFYKNFFIKKIKKYKLYISCTQTNVNIIHTLINIRKINIFTKKGLRAARQILQKKKSKK